MENWQANKKAWSTELRRAVFFSLLPLSRNKNVPLPDRRNADRKYLNIILPMSRVERKLEISK